VYVATDITVDGDRDVLGLCAGPAGGEGAKQWMTMLTELRNRGVADACLVFCDGLKGLPKAIAATWPLATVQTHQRRVALGRFGPASPYRFFAGSSPSGLSSFMTGTPWERALVDWLLS
jgi:Transposase, Mutator family